jgi:hypothetical protein
MLLIILIGVMVYELDPDFHQTHPSYSRKKIPLWRERIYCLGQHGCLANNNPSDHKHSHCSVDIICTIYSDAPDKMVISFVGDHGPNFKPPACDLQERKLSYEVRAFYLII